ncbi:hypothetical protein KL933_000287 [Ogataea haglerorum]|uniref:Major facilitator superfamily (MFS) profile domain-containing protein n=1 Tax=Ogataea haglerorum TaxID=1937702 RepID=A0AAN6I3B5_9ASCO|nr:hypothetical protein KL933_000287 [Ogataea haglerorum]KAG7742669.1 hypothetical protein KL923_000284 [Ogataea haglerorum]KAG7751290.1 hypothetical protein KL912_000423 [Ogataea haglerorum]KAG7761117.1 hypothetical protein KL947_000065 [Ogataea haglerorum]KAG7804185.1 hypothetical protein KL944_001054 [Ogataea haglerorum]
MSRNYKKLSSRPSQQNPFEPEETSTALETYPISLEPINVHGQSESKAQQWQHQEDVFADPSDGQDSGDSQATAGLYSHVDFDATVHSRLKGRRLLYFTSLFSSIGVYLFGFEQGVMSLIITEKSFLNYFDNPSSIEIGTLIALLELSALFSALLVPKVSDAKGRKYTILTGALLFCFGGLFQTFAPFEKIWVMMFGRVISGSGIGFLSSIINLYQSECSPNDQRGMIASMTFSCNVLGFASSIWLDFICSFLSGTFAWKVPLLVQVFLGAVLLIGGFYIVESPRWLLATDRDNEGYAILKLFNDDDPDPEKAKKEFLAIKHTIESEKKQLEREQRSWLGTIVKNRRVITIGASSLFFAQFNGINLVSYYAPLIFEKAGFEGKSAFVITGINAIIYLLSTLIPWFLVDNIRIGGRRRLFIAGGLLMGSSLFVSGIMSALNNKFGSIMVAILIVLYNAAFGFSWGPLAWLYASEIYADSYTRSVGASLGTSINWFSNFVVGELSPELLDLISWRLYLIYGAFCFISCVVVYKFYPETTGVELEDMDKLFEEFKRE